MTRTDMHIAIDEELDKTGSSLTGDLLPEQKDYWLNAAQEEFIKTRASGLNIHRTGLEEDQKRIDDLRSVYQFNIQSSAFGIGNHGALSKLYSLPSDYWFALAEEVSVTYTCRGENVTERVETSSVTYDKLGRWIKNPFRKPQAGNVLSTPFGKYTEIIYGTGVTVNDYYLTYIRKPDTISATQDCTLADHTHREIVKIAVRMILEAMTNPRYQSYTQEVNTQE